VGAPADRHSGAILGSVSQRWTEVNGALEREFRFDDFAQALAFVNRVGELAEAADHHPDIELRYNRGHAALVDALCRGITERDGELAARTSELV
jgi:4a-hydroxytetrahydrobiopterin dehydratase